MLPAYRSVHCILVLLPLAAPGMSSAQTPEEVRALLESRVGGIEKLRVPERNEDLPQPRLPSGELDPLFRITEAKRYLGKLLFHDPIRAANIKTELGGVPSTAQTASCGSCHLGVAGSKAGQVMNFGVGGEGRMEMDSRGGFRFTRRPVAGLIDAIPTPIVRKDASGAILLDGHFDAVDSVPRLSPTIVGFAFNNRLLGGGAAGEPYDGANSRKLNKNPENLNAGENLVQIAFKVHRMVGAQQFELQGNAVYRQLFAAAFPEENVRYTTSGELNDLIKETTVIRAVAAFLRTVVTRDSPWDRFLAGDDSALSARQLRGAWLFAAPVGGGGAGCIECHSGPALNKQLGDEADLLVEEDFYNIGVGDHPLQELARQALEDPLRRDVGREEVTADPSHRFKFKTPTLRQLKHAGQLMHSGEIESVRDAVEYFNRGEPASREAAGTGTLTARFTHPRGAGLKGLGLSEADADALADFIENGLHDPAFERFDPDSPTDTFEPNERDLTYSSALKALGARDGLLPSLRAVGNDDERTRRETIFVRGDATGDERIALSDAVRLIDYLFLGREAPSNMAASDANHDGRVDIGDPVFLLSFLFLGGPAPALPYPGLGQLMP